MPEAGTFRRVHDPELGNVRWKGGGDRGKPGEEGVGRQKEPGC